MAKTAYKTSYRRLDDTYGRVRRFWCTADTKFDTYEEAERFGMEVVKNPNIDAYKVKEVKGR